MALRMEHAPVATKEDGDEEGRLCALCKQNCYFSFVAWCVARRHCLGLTVFALDLKFRRHLVVGLADGCWVLLDWRSPCDMSKNACLCHHSQLCKCHPSRHVTTHRPLSSQLYATATFICSVFAGSVLPAHDLRARDAAGQLSHRCGRRRRCRGQATHPRTRCAPFGPQSPPPCFDDNIVRGT